MEYQISTRIKVEFINDTKFGYVSFLNDEFRCIINTENDYMNVSKLLLDGSKDVGKRKEYSDWFRQAKDIVEEVENYLDNIREFTGVQELKSIDNRYQNSEPPIISFQMERRDSCNFIISIITMNYLYHILLNMNIEILL